MAKESLEVGELIGLKIIDGKEAAVKGLIRSLKNQRKEFISQKAEWMKQTRIFLGIEEVEWKMWMRNTWGEWNLLDVGWAGWSHDFQAYGKWAAAINKWSKIWKGPTHIGWFSDGQVADGEAESEIQAKFTGSEQ